MKTVCEENKCTGCGACADICPRDAVSIRDEIAQYNAIINEDLCVDCHLCRDVCQVNGPVKLQSPQQCFEGWSKGENRARASSGGIATGVAGAFIRSGGLVCACTFKNGRFVFELAQSEEELRNFAGSKYVKSNPEGIYSEIRQQLQKNHKVLFIGLPCQVGGLKKFIGNDPVLRNLYTVDLICHGTPSPEILKSCLQKYGVNLEEVQEISFREKSAFHIAVDGRKLTVPGTVDEYTTGFLKGLFYTENCYECKYACTERCGDLTLGDSWGSQSSADEIGRGISLILCQTAKGNELLEMTDLYLKDVDLKRAVSFNRQLSHPVPIHHKRSFFFSELEKKKNIITIIRKCCPKQAVKHLAMKMRYFIFRGE